MQAPFDSGANNRFHFVESFLPCVIMPGQDFVVRGLTEIYDIIPFLIHVAANPPIYFEDRARVGDEAGALPFITPGIDSVVLDFYDFVNIHNSIDFKVWRIRERSSPQTLKTGS